MELYARVRRAVVVDKMSERDAGQQFGRAPHTAASLAPSHAPPGYRRQQPVRRPSLSLGRDHRSDPLKDDNAQGRKQRHTAKRSSIGCAKSTATWGLHDRQGLRSTAQVELAARCSCRSNIRAAMHKPTSGSDGSDWRHEMQDALLAVDLPQSDDCFVMAFPTEAVPGRSQPALNYFGGVSRRFSTTTPSWRFGDIPQASLISAIGHVTYEYDPAQLVHTPWCG